MDFFNQLIPKGDTSGGSGFFSLPWGASGGSEEVYKTTESRTAGEMQQYANDRDGDGASQSSLGSRPSRSSVKFTAEQKLHEDRSGYSAEGSVRASDRKDAVESLSARDADTPAQSARKAHEDGLESAHLPLTNLSHMDLKRRIEENLENLRRTVNEVREEKDELLDEVESVLLEFKQIALLNKDIAVETLEEQQQSSSVAELTYRVNQQRKNIEAIETDIKHMDSALLITKNMKHASYMKGVSGDMGPRLALRREELLEKKRQAIEELGAHQAELLSLQPAAAADHKMHHTFKG